MSNFKVVIAGHKGHGKSTLIRKLLYAAGDMPKENKQLYGNMEQSGKLGFTDNGLLEVRHKNVIGSISDMRSKRYTFIDSANPKEFLKNMVTGTINADAAVLIVDALEGIVSQTYQYAYLISMLGIKEIIIVVNKMDCLLYNKSRFLSRVSTIIDFFKKLKIQLTAVIPISAKYGDNVVAKSDRMEWNASLTLIEALDSLAPKSNLSLLPLRFVVYCPRISKVKTTILGKITSGKLVKNQQLIFGPVHHTTRVLSIEVSGKEREFVEAPESVALILEDTANIERGQIGFDISSPSLTTNCLIAHVFWIDATPLSSADTVDILCGTQYCSGQVGKISEIREVACLETNHNCSKQLSEMQVADVRIRLNSPVCADPFNEIPALGKFTIIQNERITGGGVLK